MYKPRNPWMYLSQPVTDLALAATVLLISDAALAGIVGSAHDLSSESWSGGEVCLPCHTPHNTDPTVAPLWNHEVDASGFTMYASTTVDMTAATEPQGVSLACLGCHDGVTAIDSFGGASGSTFMTGSALVGKDLTDDHPISITYDPTQDPDFHPISNVTDAGLRLFGSPTANQVECASCHDPHEGDISLFLRLSNNNSALCFACHNK